MPFQEPLQKLETAKETERASFRDKEPYCAKRDQLPGSMTGAGSRVSGEDKGCTNPDFFRYSPVMQGNENYDEIVRNVNRFRNIREHTQVVITADTGIQTHRYPPSRA